MKLQFINLIISIFLLGNSSVFAKDIYVSTVGSDSHTGTKKLPFASFERAVEEVKKFAGKETVTVWVNEGTYYLSETLLFESELSGTPEKPIIFSALPGAKVTIKGSKLLQQLNWEEYKDGIFVTKVPAAHNFDQLFINGARQNRARFPNFDYKNPIRGGKGYLQVSDGTNSRYDQWFTYNPETFSNKEWKNPETGIVHAFQSHNWGNMQYRIKEIKTDENKVILGEGGWQLQRKYGVGGKGSKGSWYFIDNIFEELDTPGEWFLDKESNQLYYYPNKGEKLEDVTVEIPVVKDLIQLKGSHENPVKNIHFKGFDFTQSGVTFMESYEPVARGDWAIHRGGAIFMEGAENCVVEDCSFKFLGGNGVFMSSYNRNNQVKSCVFEHLGESAVCFVGLPSAVRWYVTWDDKEIHGKDWNEMRTGMDLEPGPKSDDYPKNCVVENCIMHDFGDIGKQVAGVYISMSHKIRVSHNTIYNCPRAGICINDGTWGGHIIENCDIWETVRETGEHGPFNSWGRERQWLGGSGTDKDFYKELTRLDAIDIVTVRNNRIANYRKSISAGNWTIDLDDGSSYFEIYNNLNLGSTIKLRDGMARKVYNNITVSAVPLGWHVWPRESEDEIFQNIFVISGAIPGKDTPTDRFIRPVRLPNDTKWSTNHNNNLYWNINFPKNPNILENVSMEAWQKEGYDLNSLIADPLFVDPKNGNYQIQENSPAFKLGFRNFPMDNFGHQMTRIIPFGGEFSEEITAILEPDARMKKGSLRYTTDGSEPTIHSPIYTAPIQIQQTTQLKCKSFDAEGNAIGFTNSAKFKKVKEVIYPGWLETLLAGKYKGEAQKKESKALTEEINGATMVNIADDPDLIDASGGYNFGCYIHSIDRIKGKAWLNSGIKSGWIIQRANNYEIENLEQLKLYLNNYSGETVTITAVKNYTEKKFQFKVQ